MFPSALRPWSRLSASNRNKYRKSSLWGKGDRCVGLTNLPPSCADIWKSLEPQPPGALEAYLSLKWDNCSLSYIQKLSLYLTVNTHILHYKGQSKFCWLFIVTIVSNPQTKRLWPTCHHGVPGLVPGQCKSDLWWRKWHWHSFFLVFRLFLISIISRMLHIYWIIYHRRFIPGVAGWTSFGSQNFDGHLSKSHLLV